MSTLTTEQLLQYLMSAGTATALASFILERNSWFQTLSKEAKGWAIAGASSAIAIAAYVGLTYVPADLLAALTPYIQIVALVAGSWVTSQIAHGFDKTLFQKK